MLTIHLHNLRFFAFHGLYEEEKLDGNNFELDVDIDVDANEKIILLKQTVDYVMLHDIIDKRMQQATPLLETLAQDLAEIIHHADNRIKNISISIKKLSPPIKNCTGTVGVSFKKTF